jgi:hypothetical protein
MLIEQEESRRSGMEVPKVRKNEGVEAQALAARGFRNHNPRRKRPTGEEKYSHYKKEGHNKEGCWFLYPYLRPMTWVDS